MRRVTCSAFVKASIERATKQLPRFGMVFDGVLWQLGRSSLDEAVQIPGREPPVFVLETNAWRAEGMPIMRIGFIKVPNGIELVRLSLDMAQNSN